MVGENFELMGYSTTVRSKRVKIGEMVERGYC